MSDVIMRKFDVVEGKWFGDGFREHKRIELYMNEYLTKEELEAQILEDFDYQEATLVVEYDCTNCDKRIEEKDTIEMDNPCPNAPLSETVRKLCVQCAFEEMFNRLPQIEPRF